MKTLHVLICIPALLALLSCQLFVPLYYYNGITTNSGPSWKPVGQAGFSAGQADWISLAFNGNTPYIAYEDYAAGSCASVMMFTGSAWSYVGGQGFSPGQAQYTSLAINKGIPYVAYSAVNNGGNLTLAGYNGGIWTTNDSAKPLATYTSLAFDNNNNAFMIYSCGESSDFSCVNEFSGGLWPFIGSGSGFSAGAASSTSIAIDNNNYLYAAYEDAGNANKATVMIYTSAWALLGTAGFSSGIAAYTSIALLGATPYVVYNDSTLGGVMMAYNGSAWQAVGPSFEPAGVSYPSMAFIGNTPYVAYVDNANGGYATAKEFTNGGWVTVGKTAFSAGPVSFTCLAVNSGVLYLAYQDSGNGKKATLMKFN